MWDAVVTTPTKTFREKAELFLLLVREWWKKLEFLKKRKFPRNDPLEMQDAGLSTASKNSRQEVKKFRSKSENDRKLKKNLQILIIPSKICKDM